jgi:hypothetical protein
MKRLLSTALAVALLLGFGALAVLARGGGDILTPADNAVAAVSQPQTAAAPDAPMATSGINWIAIPLSNASFVNAADLATDIETVTGKTVIAIQQWNTAGQNYTTYLREDNDVNFALNVGAAYRLALGGGGSGVTWSLVGDVPAPSQFTYTLLETAGSDFNWIMLPLDKNAVTTAAQLADDIEADSSGTVTVVAVQQWNVAGQNYTTYLHEDNDVNFDVKIGYPYRITVDVATPNTSVTWPVR